ncbi:aromatic ring-hydroxylating oxygenase subunit alpha [Janthinobacterium sp. HLX7-2]|uniref:aromatic ring-hydroxylating oxygenase subunit alpha n=1 Tax=Janthinobacterium sp. HLX7-2 TaxID=1259331 RepID=UPI003F22DDD8
MSTTSPIRMTMGPAGLSNLLERVDDGLAQGLLPVEVFNDEAVFQAEMERIFARAWMFVAHESEIPNKGDYVLRRIGLDPVIVSRDDSGQIRVMSNFCRHRGAQVCQSDHGNTSHFRCPYHGWTFKNNGDWAGAPHAQEAYGGRLDAREWGLLRAPRVDTHQGFIFASLSEEGPGLKEFLGGAAWVLDAICGMHPGGMRVVGVPERTQVRADWKSGAENFAGDAYHIDTLHFGNEQADYVEGLRQNNDFANALVLDGGHGFLCHSFVEMLGPFGEYSVYPAEIKERFDFSGLDEVQRQMVKERPPSVGNIFPNLGFIRFPGTAEAGKPPAVYTSFRQWQPVAPGVMELWSWQFTWNFMSDEEARPGYTAGQYNFSSAGIFEQDDTVAWEGAPRVAQSVWNRKSGMQFNYQQGTGGRVKREPDSTWRGPGVLYRKAYGEFGQMGFYGQWLEMMRKKA